MKIVVDKDIPFVEAFFSPIGEVHAIDGRQVEADDIRDADVLVVRSVTAVDETLLYGSQVRFVASATSGIDHIDVPYLQTQGIEFAYAPGCNARSVAEYVLSALFVLARQNDFDLTAKTIGIIGCGHVGSQLRRFLQALDINHICHDPLLKEQTGDTQYRDLAKVLTAEIISLHVPLTKNCSYPTWHLVDHGFLQQLKDEVILINTSRGDVIDETALLNFMREHKQSAMVLDVWADEPEIHTELLARAAIATPHIAGYSLDGRWRATQMIFQQVCGYLGIKIDMQAFSVNLEQSTSEVTLAGFHNDMQAIQEAVLGGYDVRTDSDLCRQLLTLDRMQRIKTFSELRNHYRVRREFGAVKLRVPEHAVPLKHKLAALGFDVLSE